MDFLILFQAIRKGPKELLYWHQLAPFLNRIILAIIPVMSIADKAGGDIVGILDFNKIFLAQNLKILFLNFFHKIFILFFDFWHKICIK
jgi:hypothetical protein